MRKIILTAALTAAGPAAASCGSAFCSVNTGWQWQGGSATQGASLDLRYEYLRQDQLRSGHNLTSVGEGDATERLTVNRNLLTSFDYTYSERWGVTVAAPVVDREHIHTLNDTGTEESWSFTRLGDVRVVGRFLFPRKAFDPTAKGLHFGFKLPTGDIHVANADGTRAERTLQPGTGTTDVILGAYLQYQGVESPAKWFLQGHWQHALDSRDQYRPGDLWTVDWGVRYPLLEKLAATGQLNLSHREHDTGDNAEPTLSGSDFIFFSPGLTWATTRDTAVYAIVQFPLYQWVRGTQLTARQTVVVGLTHHF